MDIQPESNGLRQIKANGLRQIKAKKNCIGLLYFYTQTSIVIILKQITPKRQRPEQGSVLLFLILSSCMENGVLPFLVLWSCMENGVA